LTTVSPPLLTLKSSQAEGSILVARVSDEAKLKQTLTKEVFTADKGQILEGLNTDPDAAKEFTAVFADGYVLLGKTEYMRSSLAALRQNAAGGQKELQRSAKESSAPIVTYANDEARINNFVSTLLQLQGRKLSDQELLSLQNTLRKSGFASTETRLNAFGIERTTHSAFGQFSTLVSLLHPDRSTR
jgi:hypothetical protein